MSRDAAGRAAARIALGYAAVATLWVLTSDYLVSLLPSAAQAAAQSFKGVGFVVVTAGALSVLVRGQAGLLLRREREARHATEYAAAILESSPDAIVAFGPTGTVISVNAAAERILGVSRAELIGRSAEDIARGQQDPDVRDAILAGAAGGSFRDAEGCIRIAGGRRFWASASAAPLGDSGGGVFVVADRTREWLLARRAQRQADRLVQHERKVAAAIETERREIASSLHDGLSQTLAATKMAVGRLGATSQGPERTAQTRYVTGLVDASLAATQALTNEIYPPLLAYKGLGAALEWLAEGLDGLSCGWTMTGADEIVDADTGAILYRAVTEIVENVVKHSGAAHASVELAVDDDVVRVSVTDDGVGFDPATTPEGVGLMRVRFRLSKVGGDLDIESRPGRTVVTVSMRESLD